MACVKWTLPKLREEALKYSSRKAFEKGSIGAYSSATKRGYMDEICGHIPRKHRKHTYKSLHKEALKYTTRKEFEVNDKSAYNMAVRKGFIDRISSHMITPLKGDNDCFYIWKAIGEVYNDYPVYKIGVTSFKYGTHRLQVVANRNNFQKEVVIFEKVMDATKLEKIILKTFDKQRISFAEKKDGYSEFRFLSDGDLNNIRNIIEEIK